VKAGDLEFAMRIKLGESMIMQMDQATTVTSSKLTIFRTKELQEIKTEAEELLRIFSRSLTTAKRGR
jgi:hypothetical protein